MYTYLALGDSYTIGESVAPEDSFPFQLTQQLKQNFNLEVAPPKVVAQTGWTTDELMQGIKGTELLPKYDFTTLLIGVNNQYRGLDTQQYTREFTQLLYKAIMHTQKGMQHVFVISIPDWGVTPFAQEKDRDSATVAKEIAYYNKLKQAITLSNKCHFIDITPGTIAYGSNPDFLVEDQLHYNAKAYALWAEKIAPVIAASFHRSANSN